MSGLFILMLLFYNTLFIGVILAYGDEYAYKDLKIRLPEAKADLDNDQQGLYDILTNHRQKKFNNVLENWPELRMPEREIKENSGLLPFGDQDQAEIMKESKQKTFQNALENWTGRWMPDKDPAPTPLPPSNSSVVEIHHSVPMGNKLPNCDDGKSNLEVDWDGSPVDYHCFGQKIIPDTSIKSQLYCEQMSPYYKAVHVCMNETIEYDDDIPVYGTHRPVWPVYGEYKYLPRQRWLHSLEHGAVVMLYHPCAHPHEVMKLKNLVTKCLRRHIITAYSLLDEQRPLALVTWGCRLTMSNVDLNLAKRFITSKALHGPENIPSHGNFAEGLIKKARIVSNSGDLRLCPSFD